MIVNPCVCCGVEVPEGSQVCWSCGHLNWTHDQATHCTADAVEYKRKDQRDE